MKKSLHWMDRAKDPNIVETIRVVKHINYPRISAETVAKLIALRNKLSGTKVSIFEASEAAQQTI